MDGLRISDVCIGDLKLHEKQMFSLRFAVDYKAEHVGGLTIFGRTGARSLAPGTPRSPG